MRQINQLVSSVSTLLIFSWIAQIADAQLDSKLDVSQNPNYHNLDTSMCSHILTRKTVKNIKKYKKIAKKIMKEVTKGATKGNFYKNLEQFVDTFGPRISGSESLENSIDYMKKAFEESGFENIEEQPVKVPKWVRGYESAEIVEPFRKKMNILGLGTSVGTDENGITGEVVVVGSMDELREIGNRGLVQGKIVLYNFEVTYYNEVTGIVKNGASNASFYGGIAALTKSITKVSINSPHAKLQKYVDGVLKIPVASVTIEDAELIGRLYNKGQKVVVHLTMQILENTESMSRNLIGNYKGSKQPESIVLISGHIDSWDVGQGVQDDGVGVFLAYETVRLLQNLGLRPRRTIRAVIWTSEEFSSAPPEVYIEKYRNQLENHNVLMEADFGCFKPVGFYYSKLPEVGCILYEITKLFPRTNTSIFIPIEEIPNDLDEFLKHVNVPTVSLLGNDGRYFWYHHTAGDTMSIVDSDDLDLCLAAWATTTYILSDLKEALPR